MSLEFISAMEKISSATTEDDCKSVYDGMSDEYKNTVPFDVFFKFSKSDRANILWHDYEAGGTDSIRTQPMQFAAVRTTLDHEVIDLPIDLYCKLAGDKLPHPEAVAITHISPLTCQEKGVPEPLFFRIIFSEMSFPNTCVTGQNSMGYDENITRFGFWRNLLPVYKREFEFGNSRWDILNVLASFSLFEVQGLNWPIGENGFRSLKLELFAKANGITQENAHNAVDDVKALIDVSRLLKSKSPELWNYLYDHRKKKSLFGFGEDNLVFVRASSLAGAENNFLTVGMVIGSVPGETNKVVYIELSKYNELRDCWNLTSEEIRRRLFLSKEELEKEGLQRPPLSTFGLNKSPALFTLEKTTEFKEGLFTDDLIQLADKISTLSEFKSKLRAAFINDDEEENLNERAEFLLYKAGFPSRVDEGKLGRLSSLPLADVFEEDSRWDGKYFPEMFFIMRCKLDGYQDMELTPEEQAKWNRHRIKCLNEDVPDTKKHDYVNLSNVRDVLSNTDMDDSLRKDYENWLSGLEAELNINQ